MNRRVTQGPRAHYPESLQDARVAYHQWSDRGPRVLLLHPIGFNRQTWSLIAPQLAEQFTVVAADLPGHGESDKPVAVDYGIQAIGRRMVGLLDELGWDDAILVGNSLGGGTSLAVAELAPERVRGLALLGSVAFRSELPPLGRLAALPFLHYLTPVTPGIAIRLGLEYARGRRGSVTPDVCTSCGSYLRSAEGRVAFFRTLRQLYGPDLDRMSPHYREIKCPALVLHGRKDPLIRLRSGERLARELPNADLKVLQHCGHFPQEEEPGPVAALLLDFLQRFKPK